MQNTQSNKSESTTVTMIKKKAEKILKSEGTHKLLLLLSVAGFAWQIIVVSIAYFGYKTTTSVKFALQSTWTEQAATLCVRYRDVLDRGRISAETGIRITKPRMPNSPEAEKEDREEKLTVEQIFKYTPDIGKVIRKCVPPGLHGLADPEKEECYRYFNVTKYFTHEYICYTFRVTPRADDYPLEDFTHSGIRSFIVYQILLSDDFADVSSVMMMVYGDNGQNPFLSRDYAVRTWARVGEKRDVADQNFFYLSASGINIQLLEKPYESGCDAGHPDYSVCLLSCKLQQYAMIDRVPGSEILTEPYRLKPVSKSERSDPVMKTTIGSFDDYCRHQCSYTRCKIDLSVTTLFTTRYFNLSIGISVNTPRQPNLFSKAQPVMTFIEYFSFTMGCFGIWFGISFLSFDPRKLCLRKHVNRRRSVVSHRVLNAVSPHSVSG